MSLFKWSTPERRTVDQILPIIPNELYFHIFDYIAPPNGRLAPEELRIFTNLSRVCRFFANVCLPRIFYFIELSGSIFRDDMPTLFRNNDAYKPSRGSTLCTQIVAKQPLALALAKTVRACRFTGWPRLNELNKSPGSWADRLFLKTYITALSHMVNLRKLIFHESCVDNTYWRVITQLGGSDEELEGLSFDVCMFQRSPADVPHARTKIKVSHLCVTNCIETHHLVAAIDLRYLHTVVMDASFPKQFDWLSQSAVRELHVHFQICLYTIRESILQPLHVILTQAPRSLETLWLFIVDYDQVGHMFDDPAWENVPVLRSLTLSVRRLDAPERIVLSTLERIPRLTQLQSFTISDDWTKVQLSSPEVLRILYDKLGIASNLNHVEIYGIVFRLADGEWSESSS